MFRSCFFLIHFFLVSFVYNTLAQIPVMTYIRPFPLTITCNKTTNLVFPFPIRNVNSGSEDVWVQEVSGAPNILELKAGRDSFPQTNLSVITADGRLYSFLLDYAFNPRVLNYVMEKVGLPSAEESTPAPGPVEFSGTLQNVLNENAAVQQVLYAPKNLYTLTNHHGGMKLQLSGLYTHQNMIFLQCLLSNHSGISYQIRNTRFLIRQRRVPKRTAFQEKEIIPLDVYYSNPIVNSRFTDSCVIALPRFTIPDGAYLLFQINETGGGRELNLEISEHELLQARRICVPQGKAHLSDISDL